MLLSAKQETSRLLGEDAEERQARQMVIQRQKEWRTVPQNQSKKGRALGEITSGGGCIVAAAVQLTRSPVPDRQTDLKQITPEL